MCHQVDVATISEVMTGLLSLEQHLNQVGLDAGLPPLAPPPKYRPPSVTISHAELTYPTSAVETNASNETSSQKNGVYIGF